MHCRAGTVSAMSEGSSTGSVPGLNELLNLFGTNPFAGLGRTFDQLRKGVSELVHTVENINTTMTELNRIAQRVNSLLDTVEEPIQRVSPGLNRLADTLASPALTKLPDELGRFVGVIGDVATKLQPLGQLAEAAGGMFGLRGLASNFLGSSATPLPPTPGAAITNPPAANRPTAKKAPAKKAAGAKSPAKKATAKKSTTKAAGRR